MALKISGKPLTKTAMAEMKKFSRMRKKYGTMVSRNRYVVYEGNEMKAAQPSKKGAMRYMKSGRTLVKVI